MIRRLNRVANSSYSPFFASENSQHHLEVWLPSEPITLTVNYHSQNSRSLDVKCVNISPGKWELSAGGYLVSSGGLR